MATVKLGSAALTQELAVADPVIGEVLTASGNQTVFDLAGVALTALGVGVYLSGVRLIPLDGSNATNASEVRVDRTGGAGSVTRITFHTDVTLVDGEKALVDYVKA